MAALIGAPPFDPNHPDLFVPVKIGSKYYNSYEDLKNEFGTKYITADLLKIIPKLPYYFAQGNPDLINGVKHTKIENKQDREEVKKMLKARIDALKDDGQLLKNNSLIANRKWKIIRELQIIIDNLGKDDVDKQAPGAQYVNSDDLMALFLDTLVQVSVSKKMIQVPDNWADIRKTIETLPPAEALLNSQQLHEKKEIKATTNQIKKSNAFREYFIKGPTKSEEKGSALKGSKKFKQQIIKLLTFFSVNKKLGLTPQITSLLVPDATEDAIDSYLATIEDQIPGILDNIKLSYQGILRFNKQIYVKTVGALEKFIHPVGSEVYPYPIDSMIQLNYMMLERERQINKRNPIKEDAIPPGTALNCIIKIKLVDTSDKQNTKAIIKLIKAYEKFMNEGAGGGEELSNQITESGGDTTLNKELIDMHQRPGKADSLTKAVLQLMAGDNINYDHGKAKLYISSLRTDDKITEAQEKTLTDTISTFFSERAPQDRANTIYMIFQPALENMFTTKIKQVPELQFFMAEVDMADFKYEPPKLKGIETELLKTISKLPQVKEEGTTELTSVNLCRKFGITLKTDLPLVHSITQMTGNILNIVYINDKIKNAIKTRSAPVSITNPVPKTHDELSQQLAAKSATLRKQAAKLEAAALTASEGKLPTLKSPSKPSNLRTGSVSTP